MAVVTTDFLNLLFTNLRVIWQDAYNSALVTESEIRTRFALEVPSNTLTETYAWMGSIPLMREWTDVRQPQGLSQYNYSLKNRHFEDTIEVDRDTLEDDKYGMIEPQARSLGMEAAAFPARQVTATVAAGGSTLGYDGTNLFSTTHSSGASGVQSNTFTGTGTTLAAIRADLVSADTNFQRFKDDNGRILRLKPNVIIAPPELNDVFRQILNTTIIALSTGTQQTNVLQGQYDLVIDPLLTDANDWFLAVTNTPFRPFIFQNRKNPEFIAITQPDEFIVFNTRQFYYGVDMRFAIGIGLWQAIARITN